MATLCWRSARPPCRPCRCRAVCSKLNGFAKGWGKAKSVGYADLIWRPKTRLKKRVVWCKHFGIEGRNSVEFFS